MGGKERESETSQMINQKKNSSFKGKTVGCAHHAYKLMTAHIFPLLLLPTYATVIV
jgi:hypothetical protein